MELKLLLLCLSFTVLKTLALSYAKVFYCHTVQVLFTMEAFFVPVLPQRNLKMTKMKVAGSPNTGKSFCFPHFEVISSLGLFNSHLSSLQSPILSKGQNSGVDHVSDWTQLPPLYVPLRCWASLGLLSCSGDSRARTLCFMATWPYLYIFAKPEKCRRKSTSFFVNYCTG